jgi:oxygen-independent coproporphyrinogen-3 oxidase
MAIELANGHISLYQLTIEKGTAFFKLQTNGDLILPTNDTAADMYEWTNHYLNQFGYNRYEISNYAYLDHECIHNLGYWNYNEYVGIGPGAHSRLHNNSNIESVMMTHKPNKWLEKVETDGCGIQKCEALSRKEIIEEVFMMGMRLANGITEQQFHMITGRNFVDVLNMHNVQQYQNLGLLIKTQQIIKLTSKGLLLHSYLIPRIIA